MRRPNKTVLFFGSFDPLHEGHRECFAQARTLGERLVVVVAADENIRRRKKHEPFLVETERLAAVRSEPLVDEAVLGDGAVDDYRLLREMDFDVLAVGYDQRPEDAAIREILETAGKSEVELVRLKPFYPERYKSSLYR